MSRVERILPQSKKNLVSEAMKTMAGGVKAISDHRRATAKELQTFYHKLGFFVDITIPEISVSFDAIKQIYAQILSSQKELADVEEEIAADLSELYVLFEKVVKGTEDYKLHNEIYSEKSNQYVEAMANVSFEQKKDTYPKVVMQTETQLAKAKSELVIARDNLRDVIKRLIKQRQAYTSTKDAKMKDIWCRYTTALKKFNETSSCLFEQLIQSLNSLQQTGEVITEVVAIKDQITAQNEASATIADSMNL